jgi:hypothetical protein
MRIAPCCGERCERSAADGGMRSRAAGLPAESSLAYSRCARHWTRRPAGRPCGAPATAGAGASDGLQLGRLLERAWHRASRVHTLRVVQCTPPAGPGDATLGQVTALGRRGQFGQIVLTSAFSQPNLEMHLIHATSWKRPVQHA